MQNTNLLQGIDFKVGMKPALMELGGKAITIPDRFATYREDTGEPLGVVGSRYKVQQHTQNLTIVDEAVQRVSKDFAWSHSVEGARVYSHCLLKDIQVMENSQTERGQVRVDIINSYDGSRCFQASIAILRLICSNGAMGFVTEYMLKKMHVKSVYLSNMLNNMGNWVNAYVDSYQKFYNALKDKPVISKEVIEKTFNKRLIKKARENYIAEKRIVGTDTAWVQYNAFTRTISREKFQENRKIELSKTLSNLFLNTYQIS